MDLCSSCCSWKKSVNCSVGDPPLLPRHPQILHSPSTESWAPPGTVSDSDSSRSPETQSGEDQIKQAQHWLSEVHRWSTDLQVGADPPEDVIDAVSGQQGHKHVLQGQKPKTWTYVTGVDARHRCVGSFTLGRWLNWTSTFCPVSMVMARPFGTRPAVLCFFTSRTDTTGIHTWRVNVRTASLIFRLKKTTQILVFLVIFISCAHLNVFTKQVCVETQPVPGDVESSLQQDVSEQSAGIN